jgi:hypothetical protein
MLIDDICIVLQGQLYPDILQELLETYKDIKNKIISTWDTEDNNCIDICKQNNFIILQQSIPEYITQANYQVKSLTTGFEYAIKLGFKYAFRCRTDIKINNINKLLNILCTNYNNNKLSFITMYKNCPISPDYLLDYIAFGPLQKLKDYWSIYQLPGDNRFIELFLQEIYFKSNNIKLIDIFYKINFIQKDMYLNNIVIEWTKSQYRNQGNLIEQYYKYNCLPKSIEEKIELNIT